MLKVNDWIKRLKYLAFNRTTYYDNSFPANCGEINPDGSISFDCIGMEKSVLNEPDIVYKTKPAGYHVKPGQVVPDWADGAGILGLCTDAKWWDFSTIVPGEHLYMRTDGHGGVYVGEFVHAGLTYNVIECTAAWAGGVIPTYLDKKTGARLQYKGGPQCYAWEAHGKLSKYIDYKTEEKSMFNDVPTTDKNYKYYKWAVKNGLLNIDKNGNFNPDKTMKKKHIAIILYRFYKLLKK